MQKIYFDSFTLKIVGNNIHEFDSFATADNKNTFFEPSVPDIHNIINNPPTIGKEIVIRSNNIETVLSEIKKQFRLIQAAGGMIYTADGYILMIFRRGKWDLPKGKLDEGEDLQTCALREVVEETGIKNITLGKKIMNTYHTYEERNTTILKESHWYFMQSDRDQKLVPQTEEGIEKCEWVLLKDVERYMPEAHLSIVDVLQNAILILNKGV